RRSYPRPSPFREPRGLVHGLQVSPTSCGRAVSFPQYLRFPLGLPDPPCQHEQRVAEPVQKLEYCRIDRLLSREPHGVTLRAATHGPRLVEQGGHLSSPREDEFLQRSQILLARVNQTFQAGDVFRSNLRHVLEHLPGCRRQDAARVQQFVLSPAELLVQTRC